MQLLEYGLSYLQTGYEGAAEKLEALHTALGGRRYLDFLDVLLTARVSVCNTSALDRHDLK